MAFLELVKGSAPGTRFELDGDRAVIGRSADCEVPLDVPAVSRRHAAILASAAASSSKTCKAATARFSTTQRIVDRAPLGDGDQLLICDQEFRFHSGARHAAARRCDSAERRALAELVDDTTQAPAAPA